jgi:hypothetical protein
MLDSFINLKFSNGKLDDEFCEFFAAKLVGLNYLETISVDNNKITLLGLKQIFIRIKQEETNSLLQLRKFFFYSFDKSLFANKGILCII